MLGKKIIPQQIMWGQLDAYWCFGVPLMFVPNSMPDLNWVF